MKQEFYDFYVEPLKNKTDEVIVEFIVFGYYYDNNIKGVDVVKDEIVATIDLKGNVEWVEEYAYCKDDIDAQKAIEEFFENNLFSCREDFHKRLFDFIKSAGIYTSFKIYHPNGYTTYGVEFLDCLTTPYVAFGLVGTESITFHPFANTDDDNAINELVDLIVSDIISAIDDVPFIMSYD